MGGSTETPRDLRRVAVPDRPRTAQQLDRHAGKEVEDNQSGAARGGIKKNQTRAYRQYMNRRGGFNRPLENVK